MKEVTIEAENFDDIIWPSTCACCAQEIGSQDSEKIDIDMEHGFLGGFYEGPDTLSLNVCNKCIRERVLTRSIRLRISLITFAILVFLVLIIIGGINIRRYEFVVGWAVYVGCIDGIVWLVSCGLWDNTKASIYWKKRCKCIRKSKTKWLFEIKNDLFANQLIEADSCRQAQEQRRREKYHQQEKAQRQQEEKAQREWRAQEPQIKTNKGLAIASLVFAGLSFASLGLFSIPAIICGHIAISQINDNPFEYGGKDLARAGLIIGYIGLVVMVGAILIILSG